MKRNNVDRFIRNPKKALWTLSFPIIIGMLVQTLYNVVDTAYIGRLGAKSIAALTFSFPLFFVLIAINSGIGSGVNSLISRYLGEKNKKQAENAAMHGLILSLAAAIVVFFIGLIFLKPLFLIFGAEKDVIGLAFSYMSIILFGVFFMFPAFIINSIFAAEGDTKTPMKNQVFALILNVVLDPIFIYTFKMGVAGAAIATDIALFCSLILFSYSLHKKSYLHLEFRFFRFSKDIIKKILVVGMPAALALLLSSIAIIFMNKFLAHFGTNYVATYGIASRLESIVSMPIVGLSLAVLTLTGMFFGAKRYDLLKMISWYSIKVCLIFTAAGAIIMFIFPSIFLRIFTNDSLLLYLGVAFVRVDVFLLPFLGISLIVSRVMQGLGFGMPSLIINLIRVIFVAVPLAYLLVDVLGYGYLSVPFSWVVGAFVSVVVALVWLWKELEKVHVI